MMQKVKIIIADADRIAAHGDEFIHSIPQYYAEKYRNIKVKQEACQELTAGFLLKSYLGVWSDGQLIRNRSGKPMLRSGEICFNLSHSGNYVALAIAEMEIGVDMERIMDIHWPSVRKVFSGEQQVRLKQTPEKEQSIQFTRMWTECEAALKLLGTGFAAGAVYENEGRFVHWFQYEDYMVACAANEDFQISVREAGREELVHGPKAAKRQAAGRQAAGHPLGRIRGMMRGEI